MRRVVIVTDADCKAVAAVEKAAENVGARCISLSGCRHPEDDHWTPEEIEELILSTPHDPVLVLVDDEGERGEGWGERVVRHLAASPQLKVLGVVAVASDLDGEGARVDLSVTADGEVIQGPVDKEGRTSPERGERLKGDTVENLDEVNLPVVIGLGDPGKMNYADDAKKGAPLTTRAIRLVLEKAH